MSSNQEFGYGNNHSQVEIILEPLRIISANMNASGEIEFLIQWEGSNRTTMVPAKEANLKWPQMVIQFYEENDNDYDIEIEIEIV